MSDLKPCPFCGGDADIMLDEVGVFVEYLPCCQSCDGMIERWFNTEEEAAAAWNRRAENGGKDG